VSDEKVVAAGEARERRGRLHSQRTFDSTTCGDIVEVPRLKTTTSLA
jgi:hypothetical protein